jgi:hypothetical protein
MSITDIGYSAVCVVWNWMAMPMSQALIGDDGPGIAATRRGILGALAAAPVAFSARAIGLIEPQLDAEERPTRLVRTSQGRQLSRSRYHNAEGFFRGRSTSVEGLDADRLYLFGIVIQLGLSAHLLDVGFDDRWCARHIGLHVSRSLAYANASGFGFDVAGFGLLAALLSPYGKWRNGPRADVLDLPFTDEEIGSLVRLMLDHVRDVTGHPRPRGWRIQSQ